MNERNGPARKERQLPSAGPRTIALPDTGVYAGEIVHDIEFFMDYHVDPHHEVFHLLRGKALFHVGSPHAGSPHIDSPPQSHTLLPDEYIVIPAGTPHRIEDIQPATLFLLCLSADRITAVPERAALWREIAGNNTEEIRPFRPDETLSRRITPHWRNLLARRPSVADPSGERGSVRRRLEVWTRVDSILLLLDEARRCPPTGSDSRTRVLDFRRYLETTHYERWTVERAARYCSLSVRRFSGLYSELHGRTFIHDLQSLRLGAFRDLARSGTHSIPGAAYAAGFEDLSHFYRLFGKVQGESPGRWLKRQS